MTKLAVLLVLAQALSAQMLVNGSRTVTGTLTVTGPVNFGGSSGAIPAATGVLASRPTACTVGQFYFATDATAGQNLSLCTTTGSPGTWTSLSGGGGGISGATWYGATGFDGGGLVVSANDTTCVLVPPAVNLATVRVKAECAGAPCSGSWGATIAVTSGTEASFNSSGTAGITNAVCTATLASPAHGNSTACVVTLAANSMLCFAGSSFSGLVRAKVYPVGTYQ